MILLNPGPANTSARVKQAQVVEDICPRERPFGDLMGRICARLTRVVHAGDAFTTVLFGGSGTAAVEAAVASAVPKHGRLLVVDNGAYGARIAQIAAAYEMPHDVLDLGVGGWPDVDQVDAALAASSYTHLAVVHHETTTGMLNPVPAIGARCRARGVSMIVDAMSSFAGIEIDVEAMGADYLISSSNKCVQGMAGLGFVVTRREVLDGLRSIPGRSLYLDLGEQHRFFQRAHQMRFTPPVQVAYALDAALDELFEEGVAARAARYRACFEVLDAGVRGLGFRRLLPATMLSGILTSYLEPDHPAYTYDRLHDALFERGFTIYPGKGAKEATFRLANMGHILPEDMRRFVDALGEVVDAMGLSPLYAAEAPR